jgi:DNA repair protein RadC
MELTAQLPAATANSVNTLNNIDIVDINYTKISRYKLSDRPFIKSSRDAYDIILKYWNRGRMDMDEEIIALFLNQANCVIQLYPVWGGVPKTTGDYVSMVLREALGVGTCSMIVVHNHPKQYLSESKIDHAFAKKIKQAVSILGISLLDYLVAYNPEAGYFSLADMGIL